MADLFQRIHDRKDEWNAEVMVTFLEIYNEEIRDLLAEPDSKAPRGGLSIREDKSVKVVGLVELRPTTAEEVKEIVLQGNSRRTQSATHANETSSRSHAVLQVHITQSPRTADITEQRIMATLSIIDLAGSERAAATNNMGQRMVEGANINKSLLALGNCINALCESGGALRHVPYRNSKLTRLLKFSLGGNCQTVMIVCIAPTSSHFDETHNTLLYAERATKIKTKVVTRNVVNVDRHVGRYVEAINRLNIEVAELKAKLAGKINAETDILRRKNAESDSEVERVKKDLQGMFEQTRTSIADGAVCVGKVAIADAKLRAIQTRLNQIEAQNSSTSLSSDLEAERGLLQTFAEPERHAMQLGSGFNARLQRSSNSANLYEGALRAVRERRLEKLDGVRVDNVKLDVQRRADEIERIKAVAERDAMKEALDSQAGLLVGLVGMVGKCMAMINDAGQILKSAVEDGKDDMEGTVRTMSNSLRGFAEKSNGAFGDLVGHAVVNSVAEDRGPVAPAIVYPTQVTRRDSAASGPMQNVIPTKPLRRSSSVAVYAPSGKGSCRSPRSPRKSLRSSLGSQPYSRASSDMHKREKKSVKWRDEVKKGPLDDIGPKPFVCVTLTEDSIISPTLPKTNSMGGSESDWEDVKDDKTDENTSLSFTLPDTRGDSRSSRTSVGKRSRASRLDPLFLKSKGSALSSLAEDDESASPPRPAPLLDRNINHLPTPDDSSSGNSSDSSIHMLKAMERQISHASPARRGPSTPRVGISNKAARRRSNMGGLRIEKARRRSSLIPRLSPQPGYGKNSESMARRVPTASDTELSIRLSPARRSKRSSVSEGLRPFRLRSAGSTHSGTVPGLWCDPNASADNIKTSKPSWR
jgi:kinesin family protein 18/19